MARTGGSLALAAALVLSPHDAKADLRAANAALAAQDLPRAFELYRELAELGRREAQENLAVMYVNGEGVKRDNTLGYAWAAIAKENGATGAVQNILDQLEPHMTEATRTRVAELHGQFGRDGLQQRLLPQKRAQAPPPEGSPCGMARPANPDDYYPMDAIRRVISGTVFIETDVMPDGRARRPRVWFSVPPGVFDDAGRAVAIATVYRAKRENGIAVPCTIRFKVKFKTFVKGAPPQDPEESDGGLRDSAGDGDPAAQLSYALWLYGRDKAIPADYSEWFLKAAQGGSPVAQYMVGRELLYGVGVEPDERKALVWLHMAAAGGSTDAQFVLADRLLRRKSEAGGTKEALRLLEQAVASGSGEATFHLAALLACDADPALRDPARALTLLEQVMRANDYDPAAFEIRAAANALLGNFAEAVEDQERAVRQAKKLGWGETPQQKRLQAYQARQSWTGDLLAF